MTYKEDTIKKIWACTLLSVLVLTFFSICIHFAVKNILFERLGIYNGFIAFWLSDDTTVASDTSENTDTSNDIDWEALYPHSDDEYHGKRTASPVSDFVRRIRLIEDKIDVYTNDLLPIQQQAVAIRNSLERLIGWNLSNPVSNDVIFMENGFLTYTSTDTDVNDITDIADRIADFDTFLKGQDVPLIYINVGSKVCPWDRQIFNRSLECCNENADLLLNALNERSVTYIDFREEIRKSGVSWYDQYYITDHHWTNEAGLWAAGVLASYLNDNYGYSFDMKYFRPESYETEEYRDYWLGYEGRRVTLSKTDTEDFKLILPKYETDLSVSIPSRNFKKTGDYENVMWDMDTFRRIAGYDEYDHLNNPGAYECINIRGDALTNIHNNRPENNKGKKILMLEDSFGWYLSSFMACDVENMDVINPGAFTGSIRNYISETDPDIVIILYNANQIKHQDWSSHNSLYDF